MKWRRTALGDWLTTDGRWLVRRAPSFKTPRWWVYRTGQPEGNRKLAGRYTPTGKFEDCVGFSTALAARRFVEELPAR
jgi:hypothetical protein